MLAFRKNSSLFSHPSVSLTFSPVSPSTKLVAGAIIWLQKPMAIEFIFLFDKSLHHADPKILIN